MKEDEIISLAECSITFQWLTKHVNTQKWIRFFPKPEFNDQTETEMLSNNLTPIAEIKIVS